MRDGFKASSDTISHFWTALEASTQASQGLSLVCNDLNDPLRPQL